MLGNLHSCLSNPYVPTTPHPTHPGQHFDEPAVVKTFREALRSALRVRFELPERITRPAFIKRYCWFLLATLLDPRWRDLSWMDRHRIFPSSDLVKRSIHQLLECAVSRVAQGRPLPGFATELPLNEDEAVEAEDVVAEPPAKKARTAAYSADLTEQLFGIRVGTQTEKEGWERQLQRWKDTVFHVEENQDILWWWCHHEAAFPFLAQVARQVLPIQVSAAASERMWSFLTNIDTPDRAALKPTTIETLLFLKFNMAGPLHEVDLIDAE